jgi:Na+-driven multidrug efflux pump
LVGQNLGAGKPERAKKTILLATGYTFLSQAIFAIVLVIFPTAFVSIFNQDDSLLAMAATWLRVAALGYLAMGIGTILMHSFNTAGATWFPAWVNMITIWAVQVPLAFLLPHVGGLGAIGIAWAMVIALMARLVFYVPYYFWGRWTHTKVT